jgi:hypothetical protein
MNLDSFVKKGKCESGEREGRKKERWGKEVVKW